MAAKAASPSSSSETKKFKKQKKNLRSKPDNETLDALPWNDSLGNEDPFSLIVGEDEGGFLSLEEIDETEYSFLTGVSNSGEEVPSVSAKSKKRKRADGGGGSGSENGANELGQGKKKQKKKKKKKKKKAKNSENKSGGSAKDKITSVGPGDTADALADRVEDSAGGASGEENVLDEDEFYAWKELRLHPLLMKSIYRLGFREPTPIQKACIPAAAHQGKDVIGAAETGSGKTLAFGLPILQRLLEEREKAVRLLGDDGNVLNRGAQDSALRALIVTPTRELALQVSDHLKEAAKLSNIYVVPIVGGMSTEKQERLLKRRPQIVVGTPGRLWELMSGGDKHLTELRSLSFFVLDEADRMIESGHFHELQSIIDMLPNSMEGHQQSSHTCETVSRRPKKRQSFVFSATIALSAGFRKKLKHRSLSLKESLNDRVSSIESLSQRAGMRADVAIVDLTNAAILADKLEESFIECKEEDKDAYTYYILSMHGQGRAIVFCTSIAALRHISSLLCILGVNVWTLHAQMQQRARLKAIDRFRGNEHGVLVATDVAARGLDIPGVRTVIHYQLPHSAEVYVHRSGRTARASADGCCIAIISPNDRSKFASLCKSFSKETLKRFPVDDSYMAEVFKRLSLARQIDKISRSTSQEKAKKSWLERNAESAELVLDDSGSEEEKVKSYKQQKKSSHQLKKLQEELSKHVARPLQPKTFSHRYLAGAGISTLLQKQLEELGRQTLLNNGSCSKDDKRQKLVVIGRDCIEPLQALRSAGDEIVSGQVITGVLNKIQQEKRVFMDLKQEAEKHNMRESIKRKRREQKKRMREQRRKEKRRKKQASE